MKKIKPLTEGKTKSQIKTYEGEMPMTQAPPPPKPPKKYGGYPRDWVKLKPTEKELERERKRKQLDESRLEDKLPNFQYIPPSPEKIKSNNMEKRLGKIESVRFGHGGYQDACIGISVTLGNGSWGVGDFKGAWDPEMIKRSEYTQWTEEDRTKSIDETIRFVSKLLKDAKVSSVDQLKNIPVEVTFEGMSLKEWRILTEVL